MRRIGTPLATIQVVAKEMQRAAPPGGDLAEDADLILQQAERCRGILAQLSREPEGDAPEDRLDRAHRRLAEGDLRAAAGELDWLWGHARAAAQDWIALAKTRIALDDALAALTLAILQDLSRP